MFLLIGQNSFDFLILHSQWLNIEYIYQYIRYSLYPICIHMSPMCLYLRHSLSRVDPTITRSAVWLYSSWRWTVQCSRTHWTHLAPHLSNNVLQKQKEEQEQEQIKQKIFEKHFKHFVVSFGSDVTRSTPSRWVLVFLTFSLKFWILWNKKSAVTRCWRHVRWKPMQRPWPILWWAKVTSWHRMVWHQESNETLRNPLFFKHM